MRTNDLCFKLLLRTKSFLIPSDFIFLNDMNQDIYSELITKSEYKVESNVRNKTLRSFIKYLVHREIPDINIDNINEYELLSKEFDIMKPLIQIYYKHKPSNLKSSIITLQHLNLEFIRGKKQVFADYYQTKYKKIIDILFHGNELDIFSPHFHCVYPS